MLALLLEGYRIKNWLSAGPRCDVHEAVRESDGRRVVLKVYSRDARTQASRRAQDERDLLERVAAPSVVAVLDFIDRESDAVLVLERAVWIPLEDWVAIHGADLRACLDVVRVLIEALVGLHQANVLHLGLDPGHVFVDAHGRSAQLIGFGGARRLGMATTDLDNAVRSVEVLRYAAPERSGRMDRGVDYRSDLYSLGGLMYFALTGAPPFEGDDPLGLLHAHMARRPVPPGERRPDLPATLSRVALKLLEKEPDERYQTAWALGGRSQRMRCAAPPERFDFSGSGSGGGRCTVSSTLRGSAL